MRRRTDIEFLPKYFSLKHTKEKAKRPKQLKLECDKRGTTNDLLLSD